MTNFTAGQWYIAATVALALVLIGLMIAAFRAKDNPLKCYQLIASLNAAGQERTDLDKVGKLVALVLMSALVPFVVVESKAEVVWTPTTIIAMLGLFLAYAGSMSSIAAYYRSKQGIKPEGSK